MKPYFTLFLGEKIIKIVVFDELFNSVQSYGIDVIIYS